MWNFGTPTTWNVQVTPKFEDFFLDTDTGASENLVREVTQNAADASLSPEGQVTVTFTFGKLDRRSFKQKYLPGLEAHLAACDPIAETVIGGAGPVPFLAIEDFGTTGLKGETDRETPDSNYNRFWWRYGESGKHGDDGGRHGVGKITISSSSLLRFFFGLTSRREKPQFLLLGQAALRPHKVSRDSFEPYGFFCATRPPAEPRPFLDRAREIAAFLADFALERELGTGLSLVIPFPKSEITPESLIEATIENCFHQIASGHLLVRVEGVELSKATILDVALKSPILKRLTSAIQLSLDVTSSPKFETFSPNVSFLSGNLSESEFEATQVSALRRVWNAGGVVAVDLPIQVRPPQRKAEIGIVKTFIRREPTADNAVETYVRGRVAVRLSPKMRAKTAVGLLLADRGIVSKFLGDSENPSHTRWIGRRVKNVGYGNAYPTLNIIQAALRDLHTLLVQDSEAAMVKDALKEFFWTPKKRVAQTKKVPMPVPPDDIPDGLDLYHLTELKGGFRIKYKESATELSPPVRISLAYDVRQGKPKWDENDFDVTGSSIEIAHQGKGKFVRQPDGIKITKARPGYTVTVRGFDVHRDLRIHVEIQDAGEA